MSTDVPDTPNTLDYINLANVQSQLQKDLIREQTAANRPDQITPFGTTTWEQDEAGDWTQTLTLPPEQQAALESQYRVSRGRSELAEDLLGQAEDELGRPIQWTPMEANPVATGSEARQAAEEAMYGRVASRLDPMWQQREEQVYNQLWNQGLRPGDEAWDTAMANMGRERTDAYQTAAREAAIFGGQEAEREFGMDFKRRQQAIAEELQRRGVSVNEINALLTGQQVSAPGMPQFRGAGVSSAPDLVGAMRAGEEGELLRYNAQNLQDQGLYAGVTGLIGALGWTPFSFSDRRLKTHVRLVAYTPGRQPVYRYRMAGRDMIGVMADESPPQAVIEHPSGYLMVDYSRIV